MVERLYGVEHTARVDSLLYTVMKPVCPSEELIGELSTLPAGTSVGIEFCREYYHPPNSLKGKLILNSGSVMKMSSADRFYWMKVIEACRNRGLTVIFLDDLDTLKESFEKQQEAESYREKLSALREQVSSGQLPHPPQEQIRSLLEAGYGADVEAGYLFMVRREERMLEKIRTINPYVVIVGKGHGDLFVLKGLLQTQGISTGRYKREIYDFPQVEDFEQLPKNFSGRIIQEGPDPNFILERELLQRRYNAVTQWRVIPGRNPDLIGTWSLNIRTRGLFEMYIEEREGIRISGKIEDTLGTANFTGERSSSGIWFIKEYDLRSSDGNSVSPDLILYEGDLVEGRFQGRFRFLRTKSPPSDKTNFILYQGSKFVVEPPLN